MADEPLRQYPHEDLPQNTRHEVDGNTATDTYHIPGRPLPEDESQAPADEVEVAETGVPDPVLVDVKDAQSAYRTKDNIVLPPEDVRAVPTEDLEASLEQEGVNAVDRVQISPADAQAELVRRKADEADEADEPSPPSPEE